MEDTLVLIKPDAVAKKVVGVIISRFEGSGLEIVAARAQYGGNLGRELRELYFEHKGKPFYSGNLAFMMSGTVVALWLRGPTGSIARVRKLIGPTDPEKADLSTIRGDFGSKLPRNCVHASDAHESAKRELNIFFHQGL